MISKILSRNFSLVQLKSGRFITDSIRRRFSLSKKRLR